MEETAIHPSRFGTAVDELRKGPGDTVINQTAKEENLLASMSGTDPWLVLKSRIESRIKTLELNTKITSETAGLVQDMELHGFKNFAKDLVVEELEAVINLVELNAKYQKDKKQEDEQQEDN